MGRDLDRQGQKGEDADIVERPSSHAYFPSLEALIGAISKRNAGEELVDQEVARTS